MNSTTATMQPAQRAEWGFCHGGTPRSAHRPDGLHPQGGEQTANQHHSFGRQESKLLSFAFAIAALVLLSCPVVAAEASAPAHARPALSLTLIPPSPVSDQITLEIRGAVWNQGDAPQTFELSFYLDEEKPERLLNRAKVEVAARAAQGVTFRWPTAGKQGKHQILCVATPRGADRRAATSRQVVNPPHISRPIEILATGMRSTQRLGGAWVDIVPFSEGSGPAFFAEMMKMTDTQWRELVGAMHDTDQNILVITMMFQNSARRGEHKNETEGYHCKAFYPSRLYPGRMPTVSRDPLETILSEADRLGMHVMPGVGNYAFRDYTPGALRWCKKVADELWKLYGHHPSFYGWYVTPEADEGMRRADEAREIVAFFREFTPYVRRLAPDKPVLLAPFCSPLRGAEATYRKLLPHLDILCPFGFHRMRGNELKGEEAATLMQSLCDEAGCHLWMDLESFVFRNGWELHPRAISGLVSDLRRFPNFEKTLHYEFPGMMSGPGMSRQPGGLASVKLYEDYARYLREGPPPGLVSSAVGRPVRLTTPPDARYPGGGAAALNDGQGGTEDFRDPQWMGFFGTDLEAVIDLGSAVDVTALGVRCLQVVDSGIYLPKEVQFAVSDDGQRFTEVGKAGPSFTPDALGPEIALLMAENLKARGRWVRVRAVNLGVIPPHHRAAGKKAWLFADELMVNPKLEGRPRD